MCGFVGIVGDGAPVDEGLIARLRDALTHRGPDDATLLTSDSASLGFRRLSIIDLAGGRQPLVSSDEMVWTCCNGEIYNFQSLRSELEKLGHQFQSQSDSEVILHGYYQWGQSVFEHLNGMFAIVIWDRRTKCLTLARDRAGEKPLYYCRLGRQILFASEMKAIVTHPDVHRSIDLAALDEFLAYGFVAAPATILEDVRKVRPGHKLVFNGIDVIETAYWEINPETQFEGSKQEAVSECQRLLDDAVRLRMVSEVPLGAFLSGGVDSSAVVAHMVTHSSKPVETFSIAFEEGRYDESYYARLIADRYGTNHTELTVTANYKELIETVLSNFDEPFGDSSALPCYVLSELTRRHVTVALTGDGGDELFAGYQTFRSMIRQQALIAKVPKLARRLAGRFAAKLHPNSRSSRWARALAINECERFVESHMLFNYEQRRALINRDVSSSIHRTDPAYERKRSILDSWPNRDYLTRMQFCDFKHYLPGDILTKVDRTSMLVSLESRAPFLDHRLIEHAFSLPASWMLNNREGKLILKRALQGKIPNSILSREKKGFSIPLKEWFRNQLYDFCRERLFDGGLAQLLDMRQVEQYLQLHRQGRFDFGQQLWLLLSLGLWCGQNRFALPRSL